MNAKLAKALRKIANGFAPGHETEYEEVEFDMTNRVKRPRGPQYQLAPTSNRFAYTQLKKEWNSPEVPGIPKRPRKRRSTQQPPRSKAERRTQRIRLRAEAIGRSHQTIEQ